jgi:hypothetical protein
MQQELISRSAARRQGALWLALLVGASVTCTLGLACAVPLAAFGAATALVLPRREALLIAAAVWLANQFVGYAVLGYPWTAECLAWGAILGAVALLSTLAPKLLIERLAGRNGMTAAIAGFAAAFLVYEGGLYLVSATVMGGLGAYDSATVLRIFEINAVAFAVLVALSRIGTILRPAWTQAVARP